MAAPKNQRNAVKAGQLWRKKDTGILVEIICKAGGQYYKTRRVERRNKKATHEIRVYDLLKFYEREA